MAAESLSSLASLSLAGSLAMERFITIIKTVFPTLAEERATLLGDVTPQSDRPRRLIVQGLVLLGSIATSMLVGEGTVWYEKSISLGGGNRLPWWLYALMISGGSAIWTSVVQFASSAKDVQAQQNQTLQRTAALSAPDTRPALTVPRPAPQTVREL